MGSITSSFNCCCPQTYTQKRSIVNVEDLETEPENNSNKSLGKRPESLNEIEINASSCVLKRNTNPEEIYELISEIGEGSYGRVVKVKHKKTLEIRAMKIIDKTLLTDNMDEDEIENEINILKKLDHPNIIKVYEYFDFKSKIFIVNELIPNGDLLKLIDSKSTLCEPLALRIIQQILSAVKFLHSENVIHGDIKPENIMIDNYNNCCFSNKQKPELSDLLGFDIKLIDFGTSRMFSKAIFSNLVGTSFYVAPEVILGGYHKQVDLWSIGVVFYVMLCGQLPFFSENDEELFEKIKNEKPNYSYNEFKEVSHDTMDLLMKLLEKDPIERISAKNALNHSCFKILEKFLNPKKEQIMDRQISKIALKRLGSNLNGSKQKLQQAITSFITHNFLSKEVALKHKEIFKALDIDGDGRVTSEELLKGYNKAGYEYTEDEIHKIIKSIDKDNNGYIEMEEFISASVDLDILLSDSNLKLAFETMDLDSSGSISFDEIRNFIGGEEIDKKLIEDVVKEAGKNPEDEFTLDDFHKIMNLIKYNQENTNTIEIKN